MGITLITPALPLIRAEMGVSANAVQFLFTGYLLMLAASQLVIGPFSDLYGRRPFILAGAVIDSPYILSFKKAIKGLVLLFGDIKLDTEIPYINLTPHPWTRLKTRGRQRQIPLVGASLWAAERLVASQPTCCANSKACLFAHSSLFAHLICVTGCFYISVIPLVAIVWGGRNASALNDN